jgi:excisionase family DNA binding protein
MFNMSKNKRPWTAKDDDILIDMANRGRPLKKIALELGRTENATRLRSKKLGVRIMTKGRRWTDEETNDFIAEWQDEEVSNDTLVRRHKRTWHALQQRAVVLKLGPRNHDSYYLTVRDICDEMKVSSDRVYSWIRLGLKTHKSGQKRRHYLIDTDELLEFLEQHQDLFDASQVSNLLFIDEPDWLKAKRKSDGSWNKDKHNLEWTDSEDRSLVMMNQYNKSVAYMAEHFHRTECAIISRLNVLGCERKKKNSYTDNEIKILCEYSDSKTLAELAEMLPGRTVKGLEYKCKCLGIPYHLSKKKCI